METTPISPQKKLYNYRRENGLCPKCGKPLDRKGFYCNVGRSKRLTVEKLENFAGSLKFARNVAKINLWVMKRYVRNVWLTKLNIELITH